MMQLKDIMTGDIESIPPDATIRQAAEKMAALNRGMLPVTDGHNLLGMLTDRDITVRATARGFEPDKTLVRAV